MDVRYWNPASSFMEDVFVADSNTILVTGSNYYGTSLNGGKSWNGLSSGGMFVKAAYFSSTNFKLKILIIEKNSSQNLLFKNLFKICYSFKSLLF